MNRTWGTLFLAILSSVCILLLRMQGSTTRTWLVLETLAVIAAASGLRLWMHRRPREWVASPVSARPRALVILAGCLTIVLPWLSKLVQTWILGGNGEANELVWLGMLQYAALLIAGGSYQPRHEWLSFLVSCFLAIFGLATSDRQGMIWIVVPIAILAAWWLMARYWSSIEGGFVASEHVPLIRMRVMILAGISMIAAVGLWMATGVGRETILLDGWMPTSGGKQRADASARQGVGDGDMLVAARDEAFTFGAVDSDLFLDSDAPSMYDLVSEIYGEASNKKRQYARAISLDQKMQDVDREGTESKKNSREFSALRKPNERSGAVQPEDTHSRAVVQWIGPTPAWLRVESFDRFEDGSWIQSPTLDLGKWNREPELWKIGGKPWMLIESAPNELVYPTRERSAVKVIEFQSPRLMTPSLSTHIHIDRVDQTDFFGWTSDGQLMMPHREYVPKLTVVHQLSQTPSLHVLRDSAHPMSRLSHSSASHVRSGDFFSHYLQMDAPERESVGSARAWLEKSALPPDSATDWDRVMGIVQALRTRIALDPEVVPPDDCESVVPFVLERGRGPDYLIATAAVLMIRDLGIPCRLCRGFLVKPERFDYRAGQTEVLPEDLHTWAEVYAHGLWIPIEPTGAYPMPREHRSWQQWAIQTAWSIRDALVRHPVRAVFASLMIGATVYFRQRLFDVLLSSVAALMQWLPARARIRWMLETLRWRMWVWGEPLAMSATMERWLSEQLIRRASVPRSDRDAFVRTVQGLAYAPPLIQQRTLEAHRRTVARVCWSIVFSGFCSLLTLRRPAECNSSTLPGNGY